MFEWPALQRLASRSFFTRGKCLQTRLLINPLRLIGKNHGIAIEGDTQLLILRILRACRWHQGRCGNALLKRLTHIVGIRRQKQMATERLNVTVRAFASTKSSAKDGQFVMLDRVENTQTSVGAVAGKQDDIDSRPLQASINIEQLLHQLKTFTGFERGFFVRHLILRERVQPLAFIDPVAVAQIE